MKYIHLLPVLDRESWVLFVSLFVFKISVCYLFFLLQLNIHVEGDRARCHLRSPSMCM